MVEPITRRLRLRSPLDLRLTLAPLRREPTTRVSAGEAWRATRTPDGPATTHVRLAGDEVHVRAWGPGAEAAADGVPGLLGEGDDPDSFRPAHPLLAELHRRLPGLRMCRSGAVTEALVPTIIEQKVVGLDARQSYAWLVRAYGEPAPGPCPPGLMAPPPADRLARLPSYALHRFNLERRRAETVRRACASARRLDEAAAMGAADAHRRLTALPGIGPWSAAKVREAALGDPDAVAVGDYHYPDVVSWTLAGEPRGDDARMLELLEPYRGQRARVVRLLVASGLGAPKFGPRMRRQSIRAL